MKGLSCKWQKLIVWVTGYLSIIAFVIGGGYIYMKTEDADVKKSAKTVFLISIAFTALDIIFLIVRNITSAAGDYQALNVISIITSMIAIVEAIVFVVFCAPMTTVTISQEGISIRRLKMPPSRWISVKSAMSSERPPVTASSSGMKKTLRTSTSTSTTSAGTTSAGCTTLPWMPSPKV